MRWILLIVGLPLAELFLLVLLSPVIGGWATIGIIASTAALGVAVIVHEGRRLQQSFFALILHRRTEDLSFTRGILVMLAGALLVVPGYITDICGLMLLIPITRKIVAEHIGSSMRSAVGRAEASGEFHHSIVGFAGNRSGVDDADRGDRSLFGGRRRQNGVDVIDAEGVEIQDTLLLGEGGNED